MLSRIEELEAIRQRLAELERRLAALEAGNDPGTVRGALSRLTEVERRIVGLVMAGRTNGDVAERLILTPEAVEWSLTKAYRKLGVRSRTELAAKLGAEAPPAKAFGRTPGGISGSRAEAEDGGETFRNDLTE
jgi:DNA-binding CsgD family transcriptional regulator